MLTNECQSEYPSGPARTKEVNEDELEKSSDDDDDEEQEEEEGRSKETVSPQRGRRVSFISVATSDDMVGCESPAAPAPALPPVVLSTPAAPAASPLPPPPLVDHEDEKSDKKIFKVTKRSLVKKLFSIVHEERYKTDYGGMETLVRVHKKGILFKQGKFFGIWKRIFVVLDGNLLTQYKSSQGYYTDSTPYKVMELTGSSVLSYTKYSNCFTIYTKTSSWVMMTENEMEFIEWMNALKTVITALFS